jgi:hypothetical protein
MRFKRGLPRYSCLALSLTVIGLLGASCGIKIGEKPSANQTISIGGGTTQCLDGSIDKISQYLHGQSSAAEISALFDCATNALQLFENETTGTVPGQYSAAELQKFLERYFLNNFRMSDTLMAEIMQLKATLIGGDTQTLSRADLERAQALMQELKTLSVSMIPYIPRLNPTDIAGLSQFDLDGAIAGLKAGATSLNQIIQANATPYTFDHLNTLLEQMELFTDSTQDRQALETFQNYLPFIQQLKKIVISSGAESDTAQMDKADWQTLLSVGTDIYSVYLRYIYILKNDDSFIHGQGLEDLLSVANSVKPLIDQMIERNGGQISYANLDELLQSPSIPVLAPYVIPSAANQPAADPSAYFTVGSYTACRTDLQGFLRVLGRRYLKDAGPSIAPLFLHLKANEAAPAAPCVYPAPPTADTDGISESEIDRLWNYLQFLANGQRYVAAAFEHENGTSAAWGDSYPAKSLAKPTLADLFSGTPSIEKDPFMQDAGNQLRSYLQEADLFPLFHGDTLRLAYFGSNGERHHSFTEMSLVNALRSLIDLAFSAYIPHTTVGAVGSAEDKAARAQELARGASRAGIQALYIDLLPIGRDIKLFNPLSDPVASADKRFLESSLFTYHATGANDGDYMTVEQATDYVATLLSTEVLESDMYSDISAVCPSGPIDAYGKATIGANCFDQKFFGEFNEKYWRKDLPSLYAYYNSLPSRPVKNPTASSANPKGVDNTVYRETFVCLMDQVSRTQPYPEGPNWVDTDDLDQYSAIGHYLEELFTRFDKNDDGFIDFSEAMNIFPLVDPLLIEAQASAQPSNPLSSLTSDYRRLAAITYMLKTGNIPSTVDFIWWDVQDYFNFNDWFNGSEHASWQFNADRARILQIINLISSVESSTSSSGGTVTVDTQSCFKY